MILLKDVSYAWEDGRTALKNINLEIKKGEFVLISGKSGSGKSTLGSVMNGRIPHYYKGKMQGEAFVSGKDISKLLLHEVGHIVGTVFQDPRSQFFTTTKDEEIAFGLQTICKSREEIKHRVEEVYAELDIEELKGKSVFELSSGQKQKQYILNHLDFNMECGKAIGLIGLNDTGKTTFARVISGLEKIKEGKIWAEKDKELNRKDLMDMSYFVFQDSDCQLFSESVLDEMLLGMEGKDKKENTQKAKSILNVLGLDKYIDKHPFALSRGEKQRLTIACGIMKRAKVFIYDEPTSGCDKDSMLSVAKLIEEQLKNGTTVLVISHDFEFLANTVSKLWVMGDGKIEKVLNMSESNKFLILDKMRDYVKNFFEVLDWEKVSKNYENSRAE